MDEREKRNESVGVGGNGGFLFGLPSLATRWSLIGAE